MSKAPDPDASAVRPAPPSPAVPDWARRLSRLLDSAIRIPGTEIEIGLDPVLGALLPELGDALTAVISLTLLTVAYRERVPKLVMTRMLLNIGLDALLGAIPVVGDVFDFAFKANEKNLALIERHRGDMARPVTLGDRLWVAGVVVVALTVLLLPLVAAVLLLRVLTKHPR